MSLFDKEFRDLIEAVAAVDVGAVYSVEQRSRFNFLPACPLCSFPERRIIMAPILVPVGDHYIIQACCRLSEFEDRFYEQAEAAAAWRQRRLEPMESIALENRRRSTLARLTAANLEPIT